MGTKRSVATPVRPAFIVLALIVVAAAAVIVLPAGTRAQSDAATPVAGTPVAETGGTPVAAVPDFSQIVAERPAEIVSGSCDEPGETIAELSPLETPAGDARGQGTAIEAERSYTSVGIPIESLLDGQTSIRMLMSSAEPDVVLACGEVGGVLGESESIVIKLGERGGSGFSGIAFLSPEDASATGVSVFLAGQRTVAETHELIAATAELEAGTAELGGDGTPTAALEAIPNATATVAPTPTAELVQIVDVSLLEWLIDMPGETRAGRINFVVTNEGAEVHGLVVESGGVAIAELAAPLEPGASTVLEAVLAPGDYTVYCPLGESKHREQGMETTLTVVP